MPRKTDREPFGATFGDDNEPEGDELQTEAAEATEAEDKVPYHQTEKGKIAHQNYAQSEAGKLARLKYQNSEAGKAARKRWQQSEKGKAAMKAYRAKRAADLAAAKAAEKAE